jgi:hypothetical protein
VWPPERCREHHGSVAVMAVVGGVCVVGLALTLLWSGIGYRTWGPDGADGGPHAGPPDAADAPTAGSAARRYLRGVAVALVGGFWAGALVTGPAMRLIMRLLAVTAGDDAQGRLTEADEVVGTVDAGGTVGLWLFGGVLPAMLSGFAYVVCRRLLPPGRLGGVVFGAFHLVVGATRVDPLRPDNPDFDLLGPGWLSVLTFGLACVVHGMAVVAIANRYSQVVPPEVGTRAGWVRALLPLALPAALMLVVVPFLVSVLLGLLVTVVVSRSGAVVRAARGRVPVVAGRVAALVLVLALLPGTISDLQDVVDRGSDDRFAIDDA